MNIVKTFSQSHPKGAIVIYKMTNRSGASVSVCSIGAGLVSVIVPDRNGNMCEVTLGYANPEDYLADGPCAGKTPGRYANRIASGKLTVAGKTYGLPINNGPNHLHGGPEGFANLVWNSREEGNKVIFSLVSADGDSGYPGTLKAEVAYEWSEDNKLTIEYSAVTDAETVVNLTNHAYFNLAGDNSGSALGHEMKLYASRWLPTDETLIPTGELLPVEGTPMDFTAAKQLGRDIRADFDALRFGKGYDNCWALDDWAPGKLLKAAKLSDNATGRYLEVFTTQPGVQVYTGNWLAGSPRNRNGRSYDDYDGVAIECQAFPDSPNQSAFPSTTLKPGEEYRQTIVFAFGR